MMQAEGEGGGSRLRGNWAARICAIYSQKPSLPANKDYVLYAQIMRRQKRPLQYCPPLSLYETIAPFKNCKMRASLTHTEHIGQIGIKHLTTA